MVLVEHGHNKNRRITIRDAVTRARSFDSERLIAALEGHCYNLLKDAQQWRARYGQPPGLD